MRWSQFVIGGSSGSLLMWHLAEPVGKKHRTRCGRMFLVEPYATNPAKPGEIRGVCRMCERIGPQLSIPPVAA